MQKNLRCRRQTCRAVKRHLPLYIMMLPSLAYLVINNYLPLAGLQLAFKKFKYNLGIWGSPWNGVKNFSFLFRSNDVESILMMVAAEEGISILPSYMTSKLADAANLTFVPLLGENEVVEILSAWRGRNPNPILQRFVEHMEARSGGL